MRFTKMHGLGNDYIYVNAFKETVADPNELARRISDRHFGVGSDGLVLIAPSSVADFQMLMYNADGSQGEMCGNASRCVAKYVYDHGMTDKTVVTLETLGGIKILHMTLKDGRVDTVRVDMGEPKTACENVPCLLGSGVVKKARIRALDREFEITPVNTGNPHGVIFLDEPVEEFDIYKYGPVLETHPAFPKKRISSLSMSSRGIACACAYGSAAAA